MLNGLENSLTLKFGIMENDILRFKTELIKTKENEEYNSKLKPVDLWLGSKDTYTFHLCSEWHYPIGYVIGGRYTHLIKLDEEDLKYFFNKYITRLDVEMEDKINEIKKKYGKVDWEVWKGKW